MTAIAARLATLACLAALAATAALLLPASAAAQCAPALPGSSVTFTYQGVAQEFRVPEGVSRLQVQARGGHGGHYTDTGPGGKGGVVSATLPVVAGECLTVVVGGYGADPNGGFGHGFGGGKGRLPDDIPWLGHASAAGGGATALLRGSTPLVVAGGGGGGGGAGADTFDVADPGAGGDGAGGDGAGTPRGQDGANPSPRPDGQDHLGGPGGGSQSINGEEGDSVGLQVWNPNLGAGGAGGGGHPGGGAGGVVVAKCDHHGCVVIPYGGAGGGGGSSYADPSATDTTFSVYDDEACPMGGGSDACFGQIELDWTVAAGAIAAYGGGRQTVEIGSDFVRPLQARVTAADGRPLAGFDVTFSLPSSGASARFEVPGGARTLTATTDANGIATSPPFVANEVAGQWTATATAQGAAAPARFGLANAPAPTVTALTATANPSVSGQPVRFVAQVASAPTTAPTPQGVVRFTVGGTPLGSTVPVDGFGRATSDPIELPVGAVGVRASFHPTPEFLPSDGTISQSVDRAPTAVALSSSENPSAGGDGVQFTAEVSTVAPGTGTPTGVVQFAVDDVPHGDPVALVNGSATSAAIDLPDGDHQITARYTGDEQREAGDAALTQYVGADATATEVSASPASAVVGEPVTLTATVKATAGTPTGSVTFALDDAQPCENVALNLAGQATCEAEGMSVAGRHRVIATYDPEGAAFDPSEGHWVQPVRRAATELSLEAIPDPSVVGDAVELHAQLTPVAPGAGTPSGTVRFLLDGVPIGEAVELRDGRASSGPLPALRGGPHVVRAVYGGDPSFVGDAQAQPQIVDRARTGGTLTSSAPAAADGQAVTFRMRVESASPAAGVPDGAVQFRVDGRVHGPPVLLRDGVAVSAPVGGLAPGAHDVRASYLGTQDFAPAEATLTQHVAAPPPSPDSGQAGGSGSGSGAAGGGGAGPAPRPLSLVPENPLLCTRAIAFVDVRPLGRVVRLIGRARLEYAGRRVRIRRGRRVVARTTVRRDGTFRATAPRPRGKRARRARYVAIVAGRRSLAVPLVRSLRITSTKRLRNGRVRVRARIARAKGRKGRRGAKRRRVDVRRQIGCGPGSTRTVASRRAGRRGRVTVVVRAPSASQGLAVYRLRVRGGGGSSLPFLVRPRG